MKNNIGGTTREIEILDLVTKFTVTVSEGTCFGIPSDMNNLLMDGGRILSIHYNENIMDVTFIVGTFRKQMVIR